MKILLCCGGGFSSSYITQRMTKEINELNLSDVSIDYSPFSLVLEKMKNYNIIICCPHLIIYVKQLLAKNEINIPIYILPPRMYGNMDIKEIQQDARDIIKIFNQTKLNPVHFPNEENTLKIIRNKAYKNWYKNK